MLLEFLQPLISCDDMVTSLDTVVYFCHNKKKAQAHAISCCVNYPQSDIYTTFAGAAACDPCMPPVKAWWAVQFLPAIRQGLSTRFRLQSDIGSDFWLISAGLGNEFFFSCGCLESDVIARGPSAVPVCTVGDSWVLCIHLYHHLDPQASSAAWLYIMRRDSLLVQITFDVVIVATTAATKTHMHIHANPPLFFFHPVWHLYAPAVQLLHYLVLCF